MRLQSSGGNEGFGARVRRAARVMGSAATVVLLSTAMFTTNPAAAFATSYPTWSDVVAARQSAAATQSEVTQINALVSSLATQLQAAQADAEAKGIAAAKAQQDYF